MDGFGKRSEETFAKIKRKKIIPVLVVENLEEGVKACTILYNAGLEIVEVTFRTGAAEAVIETVSKKFPDMFVGAGTVLNRADLNKAAKAGAKFAVAPGCTPEIIKASFEIGLPFFPGVATATDIELAYNTGARILKFFPSEPLGGVEMLKALIAPYRHLGVRFIPFGGISPENMRKYLDIEEIIAVGGTWIVNKEIIKFGKWGQIEKNVKEALSIAS